MHNVAHLLWEVECTIWPLAQDLDEQCPNDEHWWLHRCVHSQCGTLTTPLALLLIWTWHTPLLQNVADIISTSFALSGSDAVTKLVVFLFLADLQCWRKCSFFSHAVSVGLHHDLSGYKTRKSFLDLCHPSSSQWLLTLLATLLALNEHHKLIRLLLVDSVHGPKNVLWQSCAWSSHLYRPVS